MKDDKNKKEEKDLIQFPIRIDNVLYKKIKKLVHIEQDEKGNRGYSINKYIIGLIKKDLKEGSSNE